MGNQGSDVDSSVRIRSGMREGRAGLSRGCAIGVETL